MGGALPDQRAMTAFFRCLAWSKGFNVFPNGSELRLAIAWIEKMGRGDNSRSIYLL